MQRQPNIAVNATQQIRSLSISAALRVTNLKPELSWYCRNLGKGKEENLTQSRRDAESLIDNSLGEQHRQIRKHEGLRHYFRQPCVSAALRATNLKPKLSWYCRTLGQDTEEKLTQRRRDAEVELNENHPIQQKRRLRNDRRLQLHIRRLCVSAALRATILLLSLASISAAEETTPIDFQNDLIPLFTKNGCNAGACHGAAIGRGGFKLSLYGGNPDADYDAIVRQVGGRRINLAQPDLSLLLLKPTEHLDHGGGAVFDDDSESARLLKEWIAQGATGESQRQLKSVEITPRRYVAKSSDEGTPLNAIAHYADGTQGDVTKWTVFTAEDSSAVDVDTETAVAKILRPGRHIVVARYLNKVTPIELISPLSNPRSELAGPRNNFVDDEILDSLGVLGLAPSATVDDETFLRRVHLDLTGRLPTADHVAAFLAETDSDRREATIEALLGSEEFTEYWTLRLAKLLRMRPQRDNNEAGLNAYHHWLASQIRADVSYQQIARELILATGDTHKNGPANFHRTASGPREQAEFFSELFMGSRLRCANCHNHPLDRWTQDDYHGLAAIFAKIERGKVVGEKPHGKTIHPRTLEPAVQRIPGEQYLSGEEANGREQLADWLTDATNPYFAKAIVNRLWKHLMGRGLVEPVDDFRDTNPATHPALLNKLADDFVANGHSLRHTLKVIALSNAYARSTNATEQNKTDDRFYSHAVRRPLEPEVLADAISDVLGITDQYGQQPAGTRAVALIIPKTPSRSLDILGRCGREESCENTPTVAGGLSQKLHLLNGELLNARISADGSRLQRMLAEKKTPFEVIEAFYMVALNRKPTDQETKHWKAQLQLADNEQEFLEDFVWALMACTEFVNH